MWKRKYNKRKIKNIISIVCVGPLLFWLFQIDWSNIASKINSGAFFGVLSAALIIVALQVKESN